MRLGRLAIPLRLEVEHSMRARLVYNQTSGRQNSKDPTDAREDYR